MTQNKELRTFIKNTIKEVLSENTKQVELFGKKISINQRGHIVVNGVEYFLDENSGAVKKGMPPNSSSTGAFYGSSHFDKQLQGRVYTNMYRVFRDCILNNLNEGDTIMELFRVTRSTENIIGEFMDYLNLDTPDFDDM
jgi:hypothetical protein